MSGLTLLNPYVIHRHLCGEDCIQTDRTGQLAAYCQVEEDMRSAISDLKQFPEDQLTRLIGESFLR